MECVDMEHNQRQREKYFESLDNPKSRIKNCRCFGCVEEDRVEIGDFLKYDMGMSNQEIRETMNRKTMPHLFQ